MHLKPTLIPPWNILFFGSDKYSLEHLKSLHKNCELLERKIVKNIEICTSSNRRNIVYEYGMKNNIKLHNWPPNILKNEFDVGVIVSFGHLIPQSIINSFPHGILNVHPSLLPEWRGATPIQHSVLNGDQEIGISIMHIKPNKYDVGPIIAKKKYPSPKNCFTFQIQNYLAEEGSKLLLKVLSKLSCFLNQVTEQTKLNVSCAHKIKNQSALNVDWNNDGAEDIYSQYRAFGCETGLHSLWNNYPIRLLNMVPPNEMREMMNEIKFVPFNEQVGSVYYSKNHACLFILCKDTYVGFREIVFKKRMSAKSFYNGYLSKTKDCIFTSSVNHLYMYRYKAALN